MAEWLKKIAEQAATAAAKAAEPAAAAAKQAAQTVQKKAKSDSGVKGSGKSGVTKTQTAGSAAKSPTDVFGIPYTFTDRNPFKRVQPKNQTEQPQQSTTAPKFSGKLPFQTIKESLIEEAKNYRPPKLPYAFTDKDPYKRDIKTTIEREEQRRKLRQAMVNSNNSRKDSNTQPGAEKPKAPLNYMQRMDAQAKEEKRAIMNEPSNFIKNNLTYASLNGEDNGIIQPGERRIYNNKIAPYIAKGIEMRPPSMITNAEGTKIRVADNLDDGMKFTFEDGSTDEVLRGSFAYKQYLANYLPEAEQATYYYILGRYGDEDADEFLDKYYKELDTAAQSGQFTTSNNVHEFEKEHPILSKLVRIPLGLGKTFQGAHSLYKAATGQEVDVKDNSAALISDNMTRVEHDMIKNPVLGTLNDIVNVMLENSWHAPIDVLTMGSGATAAEKTFGGIVNGINAASMGLQNYSSEVNNEVLNGTYGKPGSVLSPLAKSGLQAMSFAFISRGASAFMGKLLGGKSGIRTFVASEAGRILSGAGINASQTYLGQVADSAIRGKYSDYNQAVERYRSSGLSDEEARKKAAYDIFVEPTYKAAIAGGIIAGVTGLGDSIDEYISYRDYGKFLRSNNIDVVETGMTFGKDTAAYKNAVKLSRAENISDSTYGLQGLLNETQMYNDAVYNASLGNSLGADIQSGNLSNPMAEGAVSGRDIRIADDSVLPQRDTVRHEAAHLTEALAPEQFAMYNEYLVRAAREIDADTNLPAAADSDLPTTYTRARENVKEAYRAATGKELPDVLADGEVAADIAKNFLGTKKAVDRVTRLAGGKTTLLDRLYNGIRSLRANVETLGGKMYRDSQGNEYTPKQLRQAEKLYEQAIATAAQNRAGYGVEGIRYSFAGEKAKTADDVSLKKAEQMERDGAAPEEIWRKTMWSRGLDGKWRFEIDNSKSEFNINGFVKNPSKVKHYFKNDELFKAYPELGDIPVKLEKLEKDTHGSYNPDTDSITLNSLDSSAKNKQTLIHEIQHIIQERESFAAGTNPNKVGSMDAYRNTAGEIEARDAANRMDMTAGERRKTFPESMKPNDNVVFVEDGVSFSVSKSFEEQVHDVLNGKEASNNHVYVGETTSILKQLGLNDKPMLITSGHLKDINHKKEKGISKYHGLTEKIINKLPYILDYPAIVFDSFSENNPGAVCILSEISDGDNLPILVAIKPDGKGRYNDVTIDVNFILTMYGRNNPQGFLNDIARHKDNILYADKRRTMNLLRANRLQLPKILSKFRFNTIIHKSNNVVKDNFADTLSKNVLDEYGVERPKSSLSDSVMYSLKRTPTDTVERQAQNREDRKNFGISVNRLTKDIFDEIGIHTNRRNETEEEQIRSALSALVKGDENEARSILKDTFTSLYREARTPLSDRDTEVLKAIRQSNMNLKGYKGNGELTPEEFKRLRAISGGTTEQATTASAPDQLLMELENQYPDYFPTEGGTRSDPAKRILDTYERILDKTSAGRYNPFDIDGMASDMADRIISQYAKSRPALAQTPAERAGRDNDKYGVDIEQPFRTLGIEGMSETEIEDIGNIVRNGLDSSLKTVTDYITKAKETVEDTALDKAIEDYDKNYTAAVNDFITSIARDGRYSEDDLDILTEQMFVSYLAPIDDLIKQRMNQVQLDLIAADNRPVSTNPFKKEESFDEVKKREERINDVKEKIGKSKISRLFTNTLHKPNANSVEFMDTVDELAEYFEYNSVNSKSDFKAAMEYVNTYGADAAAAELYAKIAQEKQWTEKDTMKMIAAKAMYEHLARNAPTHTQHRRYLKAAADLYIETSKVIRTSARSVQALAIVNSMTPEGRLITEERKVEKERGKIIEGRSDKEKVEHDINAAKEKARRERRKSGADTNDAAFDRLEKERDEYKKKAKELEDEIKKTENRIKYLEDQIEQNKQKIGIANEMLGDVQKLEADMRAEAEEVKRRLREKRRELQKYRREYKKRIRNALQLRQLDNLSAPAKAAQDALEAVYKKYGLPYISAETKGRIDTTLYSMQMFKDDPAAMIEIIIGNSIYRKTAGDGIFRTVRKNLEWLGRVRGVQILEDTAVNQLIGMIADERGVSLGKKANSFMHNAMLSAMATSIRNVTANAAFKQWDKVGSDFFGHMFDWAVLSHIAGAEGRQVVGHEKLLFNVGKNSKAAFERMRMAMLEASLGVNNIIDGGGEYGKPAERAFTSKLGGMCERAIKHLMVDTDEFSKGSISSSVADSLEKLMSDITQEQRDKIYSDTLADIMKTDKNLTKAEAEKLAYDALDDLLRTEKNGKRRRLTVEEAREVTEIVMLERTFQRETVAAKVVNGIKDGLNNVGTEDFGAGDLVVPFSTVPANILQTGVEMSPLGFIKTVCMIRKAQSNYKQTGERMSAGTQRIIADSFGRAAMGTIGICAAAIGFGLGIFYVKKKDDDDYKTGKHNTAFGLPYEIGINLSRFARVFQGKIEKYQSGDVVLDLGSFQPFTYQFMLGAKLWERYGSAYGLDMVERADSKEQAIGSLQMFANMYRSGLLNVLNNGVTDAVNSTKDSAASTVGFTSLQNIARNWKNADGNAAKFAVMQATEFALGFIPNFIPKQTNAFNEYAPDTYHTDDAGELAKFKFYSKLPFLYKEVPRSVDVYGNLRTSTLDDKWLDWLNENFNPFKAYKGKGDALMNELDRLLEDFGSDILPSSPYRTYKNVKIDDSDTTYSFSLSGKEYEEYSVLLGKKTAGMMNRFLNNEDYKYLADWHKAEEYEKIVQKVNEAVQTEWVMRKLGKSQEEIDAVYDEIKSDVDSYAYKIIWNRNAKDYVMQGDVDIADVMSVYITENYSDAEKQDKIKDYERYIQNAKTGKAYKQEVGADGKKHRRYSNNWTQKELDEYIKSQQRSIKNLETGKTKKKVYFSGKWNELTEEQKEKVIKYIDYNTGDDEKITLPDEIKDKRPDMSEEEEYKGEVIDVTQNELPSGDWIPYNNLPYAEPDEPSEPEPTNVGYTPSGSSSGYTVGSYTGGTSGGGKSTGGSRGTSGGYSGGGQPSRQTALAAAPSAISGTFVRPDDTLFMAQRPFRDNPFDRSGIMTARTSPGNPFADNPFKKNRMSQNSPFSRA